MMRIRSALAFALVVAGCGGGGGGGGPGDEAGMGPVGSELVYTAPGPGALRLLRSPESGPHAVILQLVVGDQPVTGYAAGFNLPLDAAKVKLGTFTPGAALDAGQAPVAALAALPTTGPLAGVLVTAQSQKASGAGAVAADTALAPGTVLYTIELDLVDGASVGVVFDGTAAGFALRSGGLRNRVGMTVVEASGVAIGKLELR